ncbi:MAG TPA: ETEC_3214 domain-containing protein [Tepidiformaceae bacterium]|nr:ETEC_3214 domain-containing protein [Tepidiformaceae bacterium]
MSTMSSKMRGLVPALGVGALGVTVALLIATGAFTGRHATASVQQSKLSDAASSATPGSFTTAYAKLASLSAGMYTGRFADALGTPVFVRVAADTKATEKTYVGPGYAVQTVEDTAGTVQIMAVTACNAAFNPTFPSPMGDVTLGKTTMGGLKQANAAQPPSTPLYHISLATANTTLYDEYYLGNPGNYVTYLVGLDDACKFTADVSGLVKALGIPSVENITRQDLTNPAVQSFRQGAVINTFAETAPQVTPATALDGFQPGVDRILLRTLPASVKPQTSP